MEEMGGRFTHEENDGFFTVTLTIPIKKNDNSNP
jgi:hypothetical protein